MRLGEARCATRKLAWCHAATLTWSYGNVLVQRHAQALGSSSRHIFLDRLPPGAAHDLDEIRVPFAGGYIA